MFWRLTERLAVPVDSGEQHRPRGAAQTVDFSHRTQIWKWLETCQTSSLWAGRLVWQTLTCLATLAGRLIISNCILTVWRHQTGTLRCLGPDKRSNKPDTLSISPITAKEVLRNRTKKLFFFVFTSHKCRFSTFTFHFQRNISSLLHKINESHRDSSLMPWNFHVYSCIKCTPLFFLSHLWYRE